MKKISLNLDTLAVESFATGAASLEARGTVLGQEAAGAFAITNRCPTNYTCP